MASISRPAADGAEARIQTVLRLTARALGSALLLLGTAAGTRFKIEEAWPPLAGIDALPVPEALFAGDSGLLSTAGLRLSLGWTEACGVRPRLLAAAQVGHGNRHLVAALGEDAPPDPSILSAAADLVAALWAAGAPTERERHTSRQLGALIDNLPARVVFVDSVSTRVLLNEGARLLLGMPSRTPSEAAVAGALAALLAPHIPVQQWSAVASRLDAQSVADIRVGESIYAVGSNWIEHPDLSGRLWTFRDVSAERAHQAELVAAAALLGLTVENAREGIAVFDKDLKLLSWNTPFADLMGYPGDAMFVGADLAALLLLNAARGELGPEAPKAIEQIRLSVASRAERQLELGRDDGRILDLRRKSLSDGRFVISARDVTAEREAARLKDELISTVSHELRTPLTSITGSLRLLAAGPAPLPEPGKGLIEIALRNCERLGRLIEDLLDLDRIQLGTLGLTLAPTDLSALVREAAALNRPYAERFGAVIALDVPDAAVIAWVDPGRMLQVLANLLSNAVKFSPAGGRVDLSLVARADAVVIGVRDQGQGISPDFRKRLFTRFAQDHAAARGKPAGSGLGLAITKSIVEQHRGRIEVESESGTGSIFRVVLPRRGERN